MTRLPPKTESPSDPKADRDKRIAEIARAGAGFSAGEAVARYGSAVAEYLKGYAGFDHEKGVKLNRGLARIARGGLNADPVQAARNLKQQAGFSAEVAATSRDNAEAIIRGSPIRTFRSEDLPERFGANHPVTDRVLALDGHILEGGQSQMKFVGDRDGLFRQIAGEDGKFARYRGQKLELPSEQYAGAADACREMARRRRFNADAAEAKGAPPETVAKLRREAENFDQLAENVRDSGLTTEQAIFYRQHPKLATAWDVARTSHRAGLEGAQTGAVVGGAISLAQNLFAMAQGGQDLGQASKAVAADVARAGATGYGVAAAGSALKGVMQQSSSDGLRALAKTGAPGLAVNFCLSLSGSVRRYVAGEISEARFLGEVGEKGSGMLAGGMMAALGQIALPAPFVGAAVGGMIGCALSSMFHQAALEAARDVEASREALARARRIQAEARERLALERRALEDFLRGELPELRREAQTLFGALDSAERLPAGALARAVDHFATLLGRRLELHSQAAFDDFMDSDETFRL